MAVTATKGAPATAAGSAELFYRWRRYADREARDELIERFLPLARKLARRYVPSSEPYEDLVQVASLGLVKAVERFDPDRGFAFTSFAVPTIVGELKRYFRDSGWALHVDRGAQERARKVIDGQQKISAQTGRPPTVGELAQFLEISEEEVLDGLQTAEAYDAISLDAPLQGDDDGAATRLESIGNDDDRLELVDDQATIFAAAQQSAAARARDPVPALRRGPDADRDRRPRRRLADAGLAAAAQVAAATARADGRSALRALSERQARAICPVGPPTSGLPVPPLTSGRTSAGGRLPTRLRR